MHATTRSFEPRSSRKRVDCAIRGRSQSSGLRAVGESGGVAEIEVALLRQRDEQLVEDGEPADPRVEDGDRQGRARLAHAGSSPRGRGAVRTRSRSSRRRRGSGARSGRARRTRGERPRPPAPGARSRSAARALAPGGRRSRAGSAPSGWRRPSAPRAAARRRRFARRSSSSTPLARAFARAASSAAGSWSQATIGPKPSFAAAIASTPEPVPQSARAPRAPPASASSRSSSRHILVVGWAPVPNAWPGSTTTSIGARRGARPMRAVPRGARRPRAAGGSPASDPPSRRVSRPS